MTGPCRRSIAAGMSGAESPHPAGDALASLWLRIVQGEREKVRGSTVGPNIAWELARDSLPVMSQPVRGPVRPSVLDAEARGPVVPKPVLAPPIVLASSGPRTRRPAGPGTGR